MPLLDEEQIDDYPPEETTPVKIVAPTVNTNVVDTRYESSQNLNVNIEGRAWTVPYYYSQVLSRDSELAAQQQNMPGPLQQYRLIKGMELRVTDPLTHSQDAEQKSMELSGGANVYPCLIPNEGDMFVADIGDGRLAVFQVTSSERKSIYKEAVHAITYISVDFATEQRLGDLNKKTVQTLHFIRDFLNYGQNPMVTTEMYDAVNVLTKFYRNSLAEYIARYMSREYMVLAIPGQSVPIYDHFVSKLFAKFTTVRDSYLSSHLRVLNCECSLRMEQQTLLDALYERDIYRLDYGVQRVGLANTNTFSRVAKLDGVYFSGVQAVVFPLTAMEQGWDTGKDFGSLSDNVLADTNDFYTDTVLVPNTEGGESTIPLIKPVLDDDYYILSEAFYLKDRTQMSILEAQVMDYLEGSQPSFDMLVKLAQSSHKWGRMEKFYYLPILLILIKHLVRTI